MWNSYQVDYDDDLRTNGIFLSDDSGDWNEVRIVFNFNEIYSI